MNVSTKFDASSVNRYGIAKAMAQVLLCILLPFSTSIISSVLLILHVRRCGINAKSTKKTHLKITKKLLILYAIFGVFWIPSFAQLFMNKINLTLLLLIMLGMSISCLSDSVIILQLDNRFKSIALQPIKHLFGNSNGSPSNTAHTK
ncbi:hypothetical protein ACOME3_003195 [Neoechinorhynchus agilis]